MLALGHDAIDCVKNCALLQSGSSRNDNIDEISGQFDKYNRANYNVFFVHPKPDQLIARVRVASGPHAGTDS